jgi:hypothetical protein
MQHRPLKAGTSYARGVRGNVGSFGFMKALDATGQSGTRVVAKILQSPRGGRHRWAHLTSTFLSAASTLRVKRSQSIWPHAEMAVLPKICRVVIAFSAN